MKFLRNLCSLLALVFLCAGASAQAHRLYDPGNAGLHVQVGARSWTYYGPQSITSGPTAGVGDFLEVSWKYDEPAGGQRTVRVAMERQPGQSVQNFSRRFREAVAAMLDLYPPASSDESLSLATGPRTQSTNPNPWAATTGPEAVLEVTWKHDTDGKDGEAAPITVSAKIEMRAGESASDAARRLKRLVEELQAIFPPNVGPEVP